jgi:hypothetical protein
MSITDARDDLLLTMKRVSSVLRQNDIPFVLAGSFAVYARGGIASEHDVDFLIREQDADNALDVLTEAGLTSERPPEDWLVKVYDEGRLVDLIFRPVERPVTDESLADSEVLPVNAVHLPVLSATTLMIHKLLAFSQHHCDFSKALPVARSLREQIDWGQVRDETKNSPYAQAFFVLLELLQVLPKEEYA